MTQGVQEDTSLAGAAGQSVGHDSAVRHVTGQALYIDDKPEPPGLVHIALVRSPIARGRILGVDGSKALAMPGVVAVLTAADVPGVNDIAPILPGEPCLAEEEAECVGHPVALVIADSHTMARKASALVSVDLEPLDPVLTIDEAIARESYVSAPQVVARGDTAAELAASPNRMTGRLHVGGQDHFYLESQVAMAVPGEEQDITVYSSTQHPTEVQHGVAHVLGIPFNAVTVEVRRMGGAFGGKESQATIIAAQAALVAATLDRPAKLRLGRDDDMLATGKRHDFQIDYDVGYDDDGRLLAAEMCLAARAGNVADLTPPVITRALCHVDNCYHIPAVHLTGLPCKTNTVSNTAFRGFGGPQGMIVIEAILDDIARERGVDLDTVRKRNFYRVDRGDETPYGQTIEHWPVPALYDRLIAEADVVERRQAITEFNEQSPILRKGIALCPVKFGISFNLPTLNQAGALVHVYTDGSVHLNHGGTEMGQGLFVKIAQIVASAFSIDIDHVKISATRTDKVPNTSATAASAGSDLNGMAAWDACQAIKARMATVAAEHFSAAERDVRFIANRVEAGDQSLSFAELAHLCWAKRVSLSATGYYRTPKIHWDARQMYGRPFFYFAHGVAASEVAIDTLTGEIRVLRTDIIHDCGVSLNPAIDRGQIEGGFAQGLGWLTMEELWWDKDGRLKTYGPSTYKIPGSRDMPPDFRVHILENAPNEEQTIFRSKAVGEPPLMLAISVWLAIKDAISSVGSHEARVMLDAPATPERILASVDAIARINTSFSSTSPTEPVV